MSSVCSEEHIESWNLKSSDILVDLNMNSINNTENTNRYNIGHKSKSN